MIYRASAVIHHRMCRLSNIRASHHSILYFVLSGISAFLALLILAPRFTTHHPSIPTFVRDINHKWVEENSWILEKLDSKEALCVKESPLRFQLPGLPEDLFRTLIVSNARPTESRLAWVNAYERLTEILECPDALRSCETLQVELYRREKDNYNYLWEPESPPTNLTHLFAATVSQMSALHRIEWLRHRPSPDSLTIFGDAFDSANIQLKSVKELQVSPDAKFLISAAPNLETLYVTKGRPYPVSAASGSLQALFDSARAHKRLKSLCIYANWDMELVHAIVDSMPNIETLSLEGFIRAAPNTNTLEGGDWRDAQTQYAIGLLERISALHLPNVGRLGCGFQEEIIPGRTYQGIKGRKYDRTRTHQAIGDIKKVADIVANMLPHLETLKVGATTVNLKHRSKYGKFVFPWTGRLTEFLLDLHPRYKASNIDGDDEDEDPNGPVFSTWEQDKTMLNEPLDQ